MPGPVGRELEIVTDLELAFMPQSQLARYLNQLVTERSRHRGRGDPADPNYLRWDHAIIEACRYCTHVDDRGHRTTYISSPQGTYAEVRCCACDKLLKG